MDKFTRDDLEATLTASDRKQIFEQLGVDLERGSPGQGGWINGLYLPLGIREDTNPSFCINLETGAIKDHGSDYSGDLWTLVQNVRSCSFYEALEWVAEEVGYSTVMPAGEWNPFKEGRLVDTYSYEDENSDELFQVLRYEVNVGHPAYPDKTFRQRRYDPTHIKTDKKGYVWQKAEKQVPFRLPQLLKAVDEEKTVFIVEGEKDVLTLEAEGLHATCNAGGAGKWPACLTQYFSGAHVVILPDNDTSGLQHAQTVARNLHNVGRTVRVLELPGLPEKGDVSDWLGADHSAEELNQLAALCSIWEPATNKPESVMEEEEIGVLVSRVEREKVKWLWEGRLALGKLTILDGDPGLGKSTLYCDIAARITTGRSWPDDHDSEYASPEHAGNVVIVTCEDGIADTIRPRLEEAGANLQRCRVVQTVPFFDKKGKKGKRIPVLPDDLSAIEKAIKQSSAKLLIIDPLFAHLAGNINSYRDQDIRRALSPLVEMAERLGIAVLVIRHLTKAPGGSSLYRGGGSIGIIGQARLALLLGRSPDDTEALVLAPNKSNISKATSSLALRVVSSENDKDVGVIQWEGDSHFNAQDLLSVPKGAKKSTIDEAAGWLCEQLQDGEHHRARDMWAMAEHAGLKKKTVSRAQKKLGVIIEQIPPMPGNPWYWSLPRNDENEPQVEPGETVGSIMPESPGGHLLEIDHLAMDKEKKNLITGLKQAENVDLFASGQMAKTSPKAFSDRLVESVDHLVKAEGDGAAPELLEASEGQELTVAPSIAPGTIVRLPDGREGSITRIRDGSKVGVFLFGESEETVFEEPNLIKVLF